MSVTCQILPHLPKEGVYYAGQLVKGKVRYVLTKEKKYEGISISLIGSGNCWWDESDDDGSTRYKGTEEYISRQISILPYAAVLQPGSYEHDYQFHLPENTPTSVENDKYSIRYRIEIKFDKLNLLNFKTSKKFKQDIPVYQLFEGYNSPVIFGTEKTLLKLFSTKKNFIKLTAEVEKTCFSPGEHVKVSIKLKNDTDTRPSVKVGLRCYTTLTSSGGHQKKDSEKIKDCFSEASNITERTELKFIQIVPTRGELYTIDTKIIKKEYKLRVKVVLPSPHINAVVEMPILIGEQKGRADFEVRNVSWESMMEDKE